MLLLSAAIQDYLYALGGKSPRTKVSARTILRQFAAWCDTQSLTLEQLKATHIRSYADYLRSRKGPKGGPLADNTLHTHMLRLKAFLYWCSREDDFSDLISERVARRIELPKVEQKVIDIITPDQFKRLYAACDDSRYAGDTQRNRAILCLLLDTGIRVSELCGLTIDHIYLSDDDNFIRVKGKGRKQREVGIGDRTRKALRSYMLRYRKASRTEQHVFMGHLGSPLTPMGIDQLLGRLARAAGITDVQIHAHLFRHTYAVNFLKAGGTVDDIIANDNTDAPAVATIAATDKGFESQNCGTWTKDLSRITTSKTSFDDGTFIVGTDITAGTYKNSGGNACYFARLRGFGGTVDDIIANNNVSATTIVTISSSDKGFQSRGCGTWTKQ
jgi:site-specific recombinase XerD